MAAEPMVRLATSTRALLAIGALIGLLGCSEVPRSQSQGTGPTAAAAAPTAATHGQRTGHPIGKRIELQRTAMGTTVTLASYTTAALSPAAVREALGRAHDEVSRLERLMTTWREDSEVSRINAVAGRYAVGISNETFGVIAKSQWMSERSQGAFDITFASMGKLWRFDEDRVAELPDPAAVARARARIDYRRIKLDAVRKTVRLERPDTRIDLGGIAKGYAIDRAAAVLRQAGLDAFFAQAGGDLYVEGRKPNGEAWHVGIRDPRGSRESYFAMLAVEDHAFSTAGDYERAFVVGGKRYHHIIDPRTGYPATASRSVTIWAKDALTADAIDDAVFILGPSEGLALVESLDDCGALIVDQNNKVWISKRLEGRVEIRHPPTGGI